MIQRYNLKKKKDKTKQKSFPVKFFFFFFRHRDVILGSDFSQGSKLDRLRIRISDWDPQSRSA